MSFLIRRTTLLLTDITCIEETIVLSSHDLGQAPQKQTMRLRFECKWCLSMHSQERLVVGEASRREKGSPGRL